MATSVVSVKGQVVIPSSVRQKLGLKKGMLVSFTETREGVLLRSVEETVKHYHGCLEGGVDLVKALKKEKEREKKR